MENKLLQFILGFLIYIYSVNPAIASGTYEINELDVVIHFKEVTLYKISPRLLVQQAKDSLPHIENNVQFLCERNSGFINGMSYSMLCYTSDQTDQLINILGEVRLDNRLWQYEVQLPDGNLTNSVMLIIEHISKFTYNKQLENRRGQDTL